MARGSASCRLARALRERAIPARDAASATPSPEPALPTRRITAPQASELRRRAERQSYRQARFERVPELRAAGRSKRDIAHDTGLDGYTITTYRASFELLRNKILYQAA